MDVPRAALASSDRLTVLIVDDDELLADFIAMELEERGCDSAYVPNGAEAIDYLAGYDVDMLITDWQMPQMDGMELVRKLRTDGRADSHLHVTMMTSTREADAIRQALEAGVDDFLHKPVDGVQLDLAVQTARRNRRMHRLLKRRNDLIATAFHRTRDALARVQADLDAAAALHEKMLPPTGRIGSVDVSYVYRPALALGGDTFGVTQLQEGGTLFFLLDVCGHGVPAALDSFHLHHRIKGMRPTNPKMLEDAIASLNREISTRDDGSYATMLCGLLQPEHGTGWIIRAGHPPPLLVADQSIALIEDGGSMPMGWFDDTRFEATRISIAPGDRLLIYSDGLTECSDETGKCAGVEILMDIAESNRGQSVQALAAEIDAAVRGMVGPRGPEDDVSLLILQIASGDGK